MVCRDGKACGDTCISKSAQCRTPRGCACDDANDGGGYVTASTIIARACSLHKCTRPPGGRACSQDGKGTCDRFSENEGIECRTKRTCRNGDCYKPYEKFCSLCCGGDRCDTTLSLIVSGSYPDLEMKCAAADPTSNVFDGA